MSPSLRKTLMIVGLALVGLIVIFVLASAASWYWVTRIPVPKTEITAPAPIPLLGKPIPPGPDAELLRRGRYLTVAGDCVSCHTRAGGKPFTGGLGIETPFGVIYSPNISGDRTTGLGGWSEDDFYRAMSQGIGHGGLHLYPAFPYPYFARVTRSDADAILAYLKTTPGEAYSPPRNLLPFPFVRASLIGWNLMFFHTRPFTPDRARSAEWNRGAYLVTGLGHCGACHTPKNLAGADRTSDYLRGGVLQGWVSPDLTENARTGLGAWTAKDIVEYLKTGRNVHANASGPMAEVVAFSTSHLSDPDLHAIATYLTSITASPSKTFGRPDPATLRRGAAVYADACTGCHLAYGQGQARYFPPLAGNAVAQQHNPTGVLRIILAGARTAPTPTRPTPLTMPSFAWKLTDQQVADVATYVRNNWGNSAPAVGAGASARLRRKLNLPEPLADRLNRSKQ